MEEIKIKGVSNIIKNYNRHKNNKWDINNSNNEIWNMKNPDKLFNFVYKIKND